MTINNTFSHIGNLSESMPAKESQQNTDPLTQKALETLTDQPKAQLYEWPKKEKDQNWIKKPEIINEQSQCFDDQLISETKNFFSKYFPNLKNSIDHQKKVDFSLMKTAANVLKSDNFDDAYCFLKLLERFAVCQFEIPAIDTFDHLTLKKTLSKYVDSIKLPNYLPTPFIELLISKKDTSSQPYFRILLNEDQQSPFMFQTHQCLREIKMSEWKRKSEVIIDYLSADFSITSATLLAIELRQSSDHKTSSIGNQLGEALGFHENIQQAAKQIKLLRKQLPHLDDELIKRIFSGNFDTEKLINCLNQPK